MTTGTEEYLILGEKDYVQKRVIVVLMPDLLLDFCFDDDLALDGFVAVGADLPFLLLPLSLSVSIG
jgi:hypothetical protein